MSELLNTTQPAVWSDHPYQMVRAPYGGTTMASFDHVYHRVALFGGIYNNYWALEAVIADAVSRGADLLLCLGDMGGFGPHPERIIPLLQRAGVPSIAGNYDQSLAQGLEDCGCGYTDPADNYYAQISYAHTFSNTPVEHRAWLGSLPQQARVQVGEYLVHCCHGSPRRTNEFLWETATSDALLERFFDDCEADVLAFTHTGIKWQRRLRADGREALAVNIGVIGRPENDGTTGVWYTMIDGNDGLDVQFIGIEYDHELLAAEMVAERLPKEFVQTTLTGWWTTCLEILPSKERLRGRY